MNLEELKKLCEEATPGPWFAEGDDDPDIDTTAVIDSSGETVCESFAPASRNFMRACENTRFIATARTALPELIAEVEILKSVVKAGCNAVEHYQRENMRLRKVAEAAKAAAQEIDLFYQKMTQESHVQSIAEEDHDLWFHRDEIHKALAALESGE